MLAAVALTFCPPVIIFKKTSNRFLAGWASICLHTEVALFWQIKPNTSVKAGFTK
jgi:hypothetical protein